jgi:hypothetical protein
MKTHLQILLAFLGLSVMSCATGKNAFEKGNYETAVNRSINRLQSNPDNKKAQKVLSEGYTLASAYHLDYISTLKNSNDPFKHEALFYQYGQLNSYYDKIRRCPACLKLVNPTLYAKEEEAQGELAAEYQVTLGNFALGENSIGGGRAAFIHFNNALSFKSNIQGIDDLLSDARNMGTIQVVVERIPIHSRVLSLENEFFENRIIRYMDRYGANRFVDFYTPDEAAQINLQPDQVISMMFDDFVIGQTRVNSQTKQVSRDSVVVGNYTDNDGISHKVFGTVKAEVTTHQKTIRSAGIMNFEIRDAYTNRVLMHRKMPSEEIWRYEWGSFNGDKRALNDREIQISRQKERLPPPPQELFASFVDRIYDQITRNVRQFYNY